MAGGKIFIAKRRRFTKKRTSKINKISKKVNMLVRQIEHKHKYLRRDLAISTAASVSTLLNGMVRGDDWGQREGQKITVSRIRVRFYCDNTSAFNNPIRVMIVKHKMPSGNNIDNDQLFQNIANNYEKATSLIDTEFVGRDKPLMVLRDRIFTLSQNGVNKEAQHLKFDIKVRSSVVTYNNLNNGTFLDIEKNAYYLVVTTNNTTINYNWTVDLAYTDL